MKNLSCLILLCFGYSIVFAQSEFLSTWETTSPNEQIEIPVHPSVNSYDYDVDWGDGNTSIAVTGNITHNYVNAGSFQISITGVFPRIYFNNQGSKDKIISLDQWGTSQWTSMSRAFYGCQNLLNLPSDTPDFSQMNEIDSMFFGCTVMNDNIGHWDVTTLTDMSFLFYEADAFNKPMENWKVDSVISMKGMFGKATNFNRSLNAWNTESVTDMSGMFFQARDFNSAVDNWNVENVQDMFAMFYQAEIFNQDIGQWNVGNVEDMRHMFNEALAFDQNLGNWDISKVSQMSQMFYNVTLSTPNYDSLLIAWSTQTVQDDVVLNAGNSIYCQGGAAKDELIINHNWIIDDAGGDIINPIAVCQDITIYLDALGEYEITEADIDNGSTDNCILDNMILNIVDFDCQDAGSNIVRLIVFDAENNKSNCNATVYVMDTLAPVPVCNNITIELDEFGLADIQVNMIDNGSTDNCAVADMTLSKSTFDCQDVGLNFIQLIVTDVFGNIDSCTATITVHDNEIPSIQCPADLTVSADLAQCFASSPALGSVILNDNCGIQSFSNNANANYSIGTHSIDWIVSDSSANQNTCSQTIVVVDNEAPMATCQDLTIMLDEFGMAILIPAMIDLASSDNCGIAQYLLSDTTLTCMQIGANQVTLTIVDSSTNDAFCISTITVIDPFGYCCPTTLDVMIDTAIVAVFSAASELNFNQTIPINSDVIFRSGGNISLLPNFEIETGALFEAIIEDCD